MTATEPPAAVAADDGRTADDRVGNGDDIGDADCLADPDELTQLELRRSRSPRRFGWPAVLLSWAVAVTIGVLATVLLTGSPSPASTGAEAGFARDMQVHHAQGVEMAMIVRDRTDDPETRTLAYDIALTQQQQGGQMFAWLTQWDLPQSRTGPAMAWMADGPGHDMASMTRPADGAAVVMPGMAAAGQLQALREATGTDAQVLFLQLMIAHHRGGIVMADAVLQRSTDDTVTAFARTMRTAQQNEITQMQTMLSATVG